MTKPKKNLSASIKARLLNLSREKGRTFQETLQYYVMECFLFRLSHSKYTSQFVLKGALLLKVWDISNIRATVDIDMLARTSNSTSNLIAIIKEICSDDPVHQDGITFCTDKIRAERMQAQKEYEGLRLCFSGNLGTTKVPMQLDIGFGDVITPQAKKICYPVLLNLPAPNLQSYPPETVIAEKLQTIAEKGLSNSRIKDFYDIWLILNWQSFDRDTLRLAIQQTFSQRKSTLDLLALAEVIEKFAQSENAQKLWERFCEKNALDRTAITLDKICDYLAKSVSLIYKEVSSTV